MASPFERYWWMTCLECGQRVHVVENTCSHCGAIRASASRRSHKAGWRQHAAAAAQSGLGLD